MGCTFTVIGFLLCLLSFTFATVDDEGGSRSAVPYIDDEDSTGLEGSAVPYNDSDSCSSPATRTCFPPFTYCGYLSVPNSFYQLTCVEGQCRCPDNPYYDYCTCLPHIGSCSIERDTVSNVGTPTTDGDSETTYSCVANDNCNYEVYVIGNYESSNGRHGFSSIRVAGDTDVIVTVSGESPLPLILVLTSYEPVRWRLSVPSGVVIDKVIVSGYYVSTVSSSPTSAVNEVETLRAPDNHYGYGTDLGGGGTAELLLYLQQRFGSVSSFSGSYRADRWELIIQRTSVSCSFNMTRSCPVPLAPENGAVDVTGVQPIVARYSCYEGTLVGPVIRTCLHNGSWSGVEPFCMTEPTFTTSTVPTATTTFPTIDPCEEDYFRCPDGSGSCYPFSFICDDYPDCDDGSDEQYCDTYELTSPGELSLEEGEIQSFNVCLSVTENVEGLIWRQFAIGTFSGVGGLAKDEIDYILSNQTITFAGNYSLGDSECAVVNVAAFDDDIVEGTEVISVFITPRSIATISLFIIDNDYIQVGFWAESLTVSESSGDVEIAVRVFPNENGNTPHIGKPFGLRITSKDESAVARRDYQQVMSTVYLRPGGNPLSVLRIAIIDDETSEEDEHFTLELKSFDLPVVLVNDLLEVVVKDNDNGCPNLSAPAHGSVNYTSGMDIDSQTIYSCEQGYSLVGISTRVCQSDGTWSGQPPLCQSEVCTVQLDGQIEVTGSSATYSFTGVGSGISGSGISGYVCKMDGVILPHCTSPLTGLSPGLHRLRVVPEGCRVNEGVTFRFTA